MDAKRQIEDEIDHVLEYLKSVSPETVNYKTAVANLEILYKAATQKAQAAAHIAEIAEKEALLKAQKEQPAIPASAWLAAGLSVFELLVLLNYEQAHALIPKAISFVFRGGKL